MTPPRRRLAVQRWPGAGPRIYALHGFSGCGSDFSLLHSEMSSAMDAIDLLGHGASEAPLEIDRYSTSAQIGLLDECLPSPSVLLGYSMGGRLALQFAAAHPASVEALILVGASPGIQSDGERHLRRRWDEEQALRLEEVGLPGFLEHWWQLPIIRSQASIQPMHLATMRRHRLEGSALALAASMRGFGTGAMAPIWESLYRITCPVLLIAGESDAKYRAINRSMAEGLAAETSVVPGAGHCAHLENPAACASLIEGFMGRLRERRDTPVV
jgi:2-succinyl-6-hydroxy-2,4-cyclohexadiene-1-carboxylate synthase